MAKRETGKTTGTGSRRGEATKRTTTKRTTSRSTRSTGSKSRGATATATLPLTYDQIADRARLIWEQRGRPAGEDEQNWREAEAQLKKEMGIE